MGFNALQPTGVPAGTVRRSGPGFTNAKATDAAKAYRDAMGLPSFEDLLGKLGGGTNTREFGNSGLAATGASELHGELDKTRKGLKNQQFNLNRVRGDIRNPTRTAGFKDIMRLTNERAGAATEAARREAADAAGRRGFVGGYSPERAANQQQESVATAGYEAAGKEREAQLALFGGENDLYGNMLKGYGSELGAYTDLTKTAAELPTKWLDTYANLLGGLGGGFGDIFGTASKNEMFDAERATEAANRQRQNARDVTYGLGPYGGRGR